MSNNRIGTKTIDLLCSQMSLENSNIDLTVIKLESAGLTDKNVIQLIDCLIKSDKHPNLNELSLALNHISDSGSEKIGSLLKQDRNKLRVLNLHWNRIKFKGGLRLAEALDENNSLKVLDLSWNLIGQWQPTLLGRVSPQDLVKQTKS